MLFRTLFALTLSGLPLAACAQAQGRYPSLEMRPVEAQAKTLIEEPVAQPVPPAPSDPARLARIADLVARAQAGASAFSRAMAENRATAQRGASASAGSENWVMAQVAISRIEAARQPMTAVLIDLDDERRGQIEAGPSIDDAAITEAAQRIEALAAEQDRAMQALGRR